MKMTSRIEPQRTQRAQTSDRVEILCEPPCSLRLIPSQIEDGQKELEGTIV